MAFLIILYSLISDLNRGFGAGEVWGKTRLDFST